MNALPDKTSYSMSYVHGSFSLSHLMLSTKRVLLPRKHGAVNTVAFSLPHCMMRCLLIIVAGGLRHSSQVIVRERMKILPPNTNLGLILPKRLAIISTIV